MDDRRRHLMQGASPAVILVALANQRADLERNHEEARRILERGPVRLVGDSASR